MTDRHVPAEGWYDPWTRTVTRPATDTNWPFGSRTAEQVQAAIPSRGWTVEPDTGNRSCCGTDVYAYHAEDCPVCPTRIQTEMSKWHSSFACDWPVVRCECQPIAPPADVCIGGYRIVAEAGGWFTLTPIRRSWYRRLLDWVKRGR